MTESEWLTSTDPAAMLEFVTENPNHANITCCRSNRKLRLFAAAMWRAHPDILSRYGASGLPDISERIADGKASDDEVERAREIIGQDVVACGLPYSSYIQQAARHLSDVLLRGPQCIPEKRRQTGLLRCIVGDPWKPVTLPDGEESCPDCPAGNPDENCDDCGGDGWVRAPCPWLTTAVRGLAESAYQERGRKCERCRCKGRTEVGRRHDAFGSRPIGSTKCSDCYGTGRIEDGTLDTVTLGILADALEDAGCDNEAMHRHLRGYEWAYGKLSDRWGWFPLQGPHVRGCWVLDLILGKE